MFRRGPELAAWKNGNLCGRQQGPGGTEAVRRFGTSLQWMESQRRQEEEQRPSSSKEPLASCKEGLSHTCPAIGGTLGGFVALCCFQTSGPLSLDTHAALPPHLSGNHGSCNVLLWVLRDSAHFLSVIIHDVMQGRKRRRTHEAK